VSEGVDIPRLRIGVFATNTTTELFFRQAVGRLVRWTRGLRSQKAFLFIPDDPRLRRWAAGMAEQRRHSLRKRRGDDEDAFAGGELDDREAAERGDANNEQMSLFSVISAVATVRPTVDSPSVFSEDHPDDWDDGDDDLVSVEQRLQYEVRVVVPPPSGGTVAGLDGSEKTLKQLKSELRDANAEAARELVRFSKMDHRQVNAELNRLSGVRKVTEATHEQLQRRLDEANRWLRRL